MHTPDPEVRGWNTKITRFFFDRPRLTILAFLALLGGSLLATFVLRTSGFPSPSVPIALVQTVYPGAPAETVAREVTAPLEQAVKGVNGVTEFSSQTQDSVSIITAQLADNRDPAQVRSELASALAAVALPEAAEAPRVQEIDVTGDAYIFSVAGKNIEELWGITQRASEALSQRSEVGKVVPVVPLEREITVTASPVRLAQAGVTQQDVTLALTRANEEFPAAAGVSLDGTAQTVVVATSATTPEQLADLRIGAAGVRLGSVAEVGYRYRFVSGNAGETATSGTSIVVAKASGAEVLPAVTIGLRKANGVDTDTFVAAIQEELESLSVTLVSEREVLPEGAGPFVVEMYNEQTQNNAQVAEVVSGLVGGKISGAPEGIAQIGYLLGGIQLVFLVMLAFVSWRAALIGALSIPLSAGFASLYLYVTGQSLNTLVLFSLVLVIGLVVDPALVALEAVQRAVDRGLRGRAAALAAMEDVGSGLFMAFLTNVIVFAPFGVISGILGQIFRYIPATVVPATVGSYIVPLIFLTWISSRFLKPGKRSTADEQANLWALARAFGRLNERVLALHPGWRTGIVLGTLFLSLGVSGYFFGSGQVKSVQFSSNGGGELAALAASYRTAVPASVRQDTTDALLARVAESGQVLRAYPSLLSGEDVDYALVPRTERESGPLAEELQEPLRGVAGDAVTLLRLERLAIGPPGETYQVSLALSGGTAQERVVAGKQVAQALSAACEIDAAVKIAVECAGSRPVAQVDDGITGRERYVVSVRFAQPVLTQSGLLLPEGPATGLVLAQLAPNLAGTIERPVTSLRDNAGETEVFLTPSDSAIDTIEELKALPVRTLRGTIVPLASVATIEQSTVSPTITRTDGQTQYVVRARLAAGDDQQVAALVRQAVLDTFPDGKVGENVRVEQFSQGGEAGFLKSFRELGIALVVAIFLTYLVLVLFYGSFLQPISILYTVPLTFLGVFPALAWWGGGQLGFLEIIGLIILVGIVENVAIFLVDAANQKVEREGWDRKRAIAYASSVRFRPVLLTTITTSISLIPLIITSDLYRSLALVIVGGLWASGIVSLITTPILYVYFDWLSKTVRSWGAFEAILLAGLVILGTLVGLTGMGILLALLAFAVLQVRSARVAVRKN